MEGNGMPQEDSSLPPSGNLSSEVATELNNIRESGLLAEGELDSRALDAIRELSTQEAVAVLNEFRTSNLEHVGNKSAFLCGLMKTYRQKNKLALKNGDLQTKAPGPDPVKLKEILDRTGYSLDVSTGQRKYGGPPPNWAEPQPGPGHEIYCGMIPKNLYEDSLIPLFEKAGTIWDLRLMMDPVSGRNRGYCFVTYTDKLAAQQAVTILNNYEICPGKQLRVNSSVANVRLFVGNIPKNKTRDEILEEFQKHTENLQNVIVYNFPDDTKKKNRGFAFLDYDSHKSASAAKRHITSTHVHVWGAEVYVEWAEPLDEPDDETMAKVKVLYVRNLKSDVTEADLKEKFEAHGVVERVKRVKGYGFVHFADRDAAVLAMNALNGTKLADLEMEISLAKPSSRNKQQKDKRKQIYYRNYIGRSYDDSYLPAYHSGGYMMRPGRGMRRPGRDYGYENYGYPSGYTDDSYMYYNNYEMPGYHAYGPPRGYSMTYAGSRRGQPHSQPGGYYNGPAYRPFGNNRGAYGANTRRVARV